MLKSECQTSPADVDRRFRAVVIGASAGAIDALSAILPRLAEGYPLPVLVVVHVPPHQESALVELFQAKCSVNIKEAEDKEMAVENTVYFAPPNYHLLLEQDGRLSLSSDEPVLYSRPSIDVLFESAADALGVELVGVVLTGANSDGANGLKAVCRAGGMGVVERPDQAYVPTMPQAALDACPAAQCLSIAQIAELLNSLRESYSVMEEQPVKFLLVDDLKENLTALAALLKRDGLELLKARSGVEALELLLGHEVALAIIDVQMPTMSGFDLAELMRGSERTRRVPIIFLTAEAPDRERRFRGYEMGAVDFLSKPQEPQVLLSKTEVFFELFRQRQEVARQRDELRIASEENKQLLNEKDRLLSSERAARGEIERISRIKDEFLATLSHELRTPLNAILGWTQILRDSPPDAGDMREGMDVIERNARVQTQIIEDLLDMSRIVNGKMRLEVQRTDLSTVVRAAIETVRPAAKAKGIHLEIDLDPLPEQIMGDPNRLQQVFWNLLSNAIKFTPSTGRVSVTLQRVNDDVEVRVKDTGEGIRPEFLPHVFGRFRQADATTTRRHGGLGLGLAIVKQLLELHGGTISASSEGPGTGSTFIVSLPLVAKPQIPKTIPESRLIADTPVPIPIETNTRQQVAGLKILVVDDESDARELLRRLLHDCDANVITASSACEAFERLQAEHPDVLVSDIGMPEEDGYSLIRRIRKLTPEAGGQTPAVALTAYARAEDRMKAALAGFQHHVAKPIEAAELITMIATVARQKMHGTFLSDDVR